MAVYVDNMRAGLKVAGRNYVMCHMLADSDDELHEMADRIGVNRRHWQAPPKVSTSHYDITQSKRALAVKAGAIEVTVQEMAAMAASRRVRGFMGHPAQAIGWYMAYRAEQRPTQALLDEASRSASKASNKAADSEQLMLSFSD